MDIEKTRTALAEQYKKGLPNNVEELKAACNDAGIEPVLTDEEQAEANNGGGDEGGTSSSD